jgi:microcystin-dependent protein
MDEYIAIVKLFAGPFAPKGWAFCDGRLMSIAQNTALFSIIGTIYGGDGQTTFALPDLRSRVAVGAGNGPGQPSVQPGERAGSAQLTLTMQQMPVHTHDTLISKTTATTNDPSSGILAQANYLNPETGDPIPVNVYAATSTDQAHNISGNGYSQPVNMMQPYLGMNYIICIEGLFPSRS